MQELREPYRWVLNGGIDYATGYMHRGYLHQDSGVVLQPFATVGYAWTTPHDLTITPYFTVLNSIDLDHPDGPLGSGSPPGAMLHHHGSGTATHVVTGQGFLTGTEADRYQGEFMGGVVTRYHGFTLDVNYTLYAYSTGVFLPIQEVGAKLGYDTAPLWQEPTFESTIGLKPYAAVYRETFNDYDRESTYGELGIEPWYRGQVWGRRVGLSMPAVLGLSFDHYYIDAAGANESVGYFSLGGVASIELPVSSKLGTWYLTGSLRYYHLVADSLKEIDGGSNVVVGKVGISFIF